MLNLLGNSARATRGEGRITVELRPEAGGGVGIAVEDDGPGVPPDVLPHLFEPFRVGCAGGTGLGLTISQRIVERHGGRLVHVARDRGARFELSLPASPPPSATPGLQGA
jgi:signal transduction histidine kinase